MDNEKMDTLNNLIRQNAKFKFSKLEFYPDFFSAKTYFYFQKETIELLTIGRIHNYVTFSDVTDIFVQETRLGDLEETLIEIFCKHTEIRMEIEKLKESAINPFVITRIVADIAVERLKQTNQYKMNYLYADDTKNLKKRGRE